MKAIYKKQIALTVFALSCSLSSIAQADSLLKFCFERSQVPASSSAASYLFHEAAALRFLDCRVSQVGALYKVQPAHSTSELVGVMSTALQLDYAKFEKVYFETFKN